MEEFNPENADSPSGATNGSATPPAPKPRGSRPRPSVPPPPEQPVQGAPASPELLRKLRIPVNRN